MPTYEYACKSCGEHLEVVQSFRDDALTVCPNCGGELRKVFGSIGIAFRGSGFYKTDSRAASTARPSTKKSDKSEASSSSTSSSSSSSDGGSSSSKGDTKGDTKAAASS
ncbi:MAG: FmdB family zinc ribbon protein [Acidimicrobiales bacterium]